MPLGSPCRSVARARAAPPRIRPPAAGDSSATVIWQSVVHFLRARLGTDPAPSGVDGRASSYDLGRLVGGMLPGSSGAGAPSTGSSRGCGTSCSGWTTISKTSTTPASSRGSWRATSGRGGDSESAALPRRNPDRRIRSRSGLWRRPPAGAASDHNGLASRCSPPLTQGPCRYSPAPLSSWSYCSIYP
jgi:hypothetical protein